MKLLSLTVGGFRNIDTTTIEMSDIVALVSTNNYGKSNLLDAVAFAADFISASPRQRLSMMSRVDAVPLTKSLSSSRYRFSMEFIDESAPDDYRVVRYGFSFVWARDDGTGCRIVDESLLASPEGGRMSSYLMRGEGRYRRGRDTRSTRRISLEGNQLAVDVLTAIDDIEINHTVKSIQSASFAMCSSLDTGARYRPVPFEIGWERLSDGDLVFDDEDLPRALFKLKMAAPERYRDFLYAAYSLFPTFEDISVDSYELQQDMRDELSRVFPQGSEGEEDVPLHLRDELYRITIRDSNLNQPVDISRMSEGTKRLIWLLTNVIVAGEINAGCIGIEEVETSIHPRMLKELLELLHDNLRGTPLLLTSHSPNLIQYLDPTCVYVGVPSSNGVATFRRIARSSLRTVLENARARGVGYGDYLFELMSSDEDGLTTLSEYLEG